MLLGAVVPALANIGTRMYCLDQEAERVTSFCDSWGLKVVCLVTPNHCVVRIKLTHSPLGRLRNLLCLQLGRVESDGLDLRATTKPSDQIPSQKRWRLLVRVAAWALLAWSHVLMVEVVGGGGNAKRRKQEDEGTGG